MDRRQFLVFGGLSTLALAAPSAWGPRATARDRGVLARPALMAMLGSPDRVRQLGRRYRVVVPAEDDRETLVAALRSEVGSGSPSTLRSRLDARVRADFATGRTITVQGWVLARTEARQCALFSFT